MTPDAEKLDTDSRRRYARMIAELTRRVVEPKPFHGDPHPGNFMVMDDGTLALLDFGQVEEIKATEADHVLDLALAVARNAPGDVAGALAGMGETSVSPATLGKLTEAVRTILSSGADGLGASFAFELLRVANQSGVKIAPTYTAVFKHFATAEGVIRSLDPDFDVTAEFRNQLMEYGQRRYGDAFWEYAAAGRKP